MLHNYTMSIMGFINVCKIHSKFISRKYTSSARNKLAFNQLERLPKQARHNGQWESVVGLEIHAQISSKSKLFSGSETRFDAAPNTQVSFFDASLPGTLPVLNKRCVEAGILTALALDCTIHKTSLFDRKHYFYADLPTGYQITQQRMPLATDGIIEFIVYNPAAHIGPYLCSTRLHQLQLEQDSGKSLHFESEGVTLVNLNRAGVGLMELVFEADLSSGEEAAALIKELQLIMLKLGTCSCRMEEGAFRVDANISVNRPGEPWGIRTEVKNVNSMRFVAKAIEFEVERQINLLENGGKVVNETRMYDSDIGKTVTMRDKEVVQDYRYMPEPNLPPLRLCEDGDDIPRHLQKHIINIDELRRKLPVLPRESRANLIENYGLPLEDIIFVLHKEGMYDYYEKTMLKKDRDPKKALNILRHNVGMILNRKDMSFSECPIDPESFGEILDMVQGEQISTGTMDDLISMLFQGVKHSPKEIVKENNWFCISNEEELEKICRDVIAQSSDLLKEHKKGKRHALNKLMEKVNKSTQKQAHMSKAKKIMLQLLDSNEKLTNS